MAGLVATFTIESDGAHDAIGELQALVERLPCRHGDAFRALDRCLRQIFDGEVEISLPEVHDLGAGILTWSLPPELSACLAEGRRLGVI